MAKTKARFIEPMSLLRMEKLRQGADWLTRSNWTVTGHS